MYPGQTSPRADFLSRSRVFSEKDAKFTSVFFYLVVVPCRVLARAGYGSNRCI